MVSNDLEQMKIDMKRLSARRQHLLDRFIAEMEFALKLSKVARASGWDKLMERAMKMVSTAMAGDDSDEVALAVAEAERLLTPIGRIAKQYTIHCVGHGHIDMNWMWSWPETVAVTNDTFTTVLKLMDEFPDFCYSQSQASVYAIMKDYNPDLFEQIKKRVAEGRWEITASHWVEGDKNLPSGEALGRHLLYTRRFMKEHFGLNPEDIAIDWSPDTFGHAHTIPSIDSRGGVKRYYMCRGGRFEKPPVFWWQGPDGSKILVNIETTWYNDFIGPHNAIALLNFAEKTGLKDWMCVYGVGDHGGGPTRRDLLRTIDMNTWPIYPNFKFATTKHYYEILEENGKKWKTINGELNFEFTGCYTTQTLVKKANRFSENQLVEAETAALLANRVAGRPYPSADLRQGWIDTLFSHFHDILPGSGVRATRHYNQGLFQKITAMTCMVKTQSLRAVAAKIDTSFAGTDPKVALAPEQENLALGGGAGLGASLGGISSAGHVSNWPRAFVLFNPTAWQRTETVQVVVWDAETGLVPGNLADQSFTVRTADGKTIPSQKIESNQNYWGHSSVTLAFPATVEALGYTTYVIDCGNDIKTPIPMDYEMVSISSLAMENEFLAVDFDRSTGGVIKLIDKKTGKNLVSADKPLGVLEYVLERPDIMSAWVIHEAQKRSDVEIISIKKPQKGPHMTSVVAKGKINDSTFEITYSLKAGEPWLNIDLKAVWVERGGPEIGTPSLTMKFPLALEDAKGRYEIPFGSIERDLNQGEEVPSQQWADITGRQGAKNTAGCAVLNDSKYGHSLTGSTLRVTLIRSSYEPDILPEIGEHAVRLAVAPHGETLSVSELTRLGAAFNHPLEVIGTDIHKGALASVSEPIVACKPENVLALAVKKAEDDDTIIVRLLETAGKATTAEVKLSDAFFSSVADVTEVDLQERPIEKSSAKKTKSGFSVKLPAHGITGVKIRLA